MFSTSIYQRDTFGHRNLKVFSSYVFFYNSQRPNRSVPGNCLS